MNALQIILLGSSMLVGFALLTLPVIAACATWHAWEDLPREIYAQFPQRFGPLRPLHLWFTCGALLFVSQMLGRLNFPTLHSIADTLGISLVAVLLAWHLHWATTTLRRNSALDSRLQRFARRTLWASAIALTILLASAALP